MIRILNSVFHTDGWGNRCVALAAGVHEESADTLRQVALGNGVHLTAEEAAAHAAAAAASEPNAEPADTVAPAPAAEPAPAPAAAKSKRTT
jgi:hypothetical protein